MRIVFLLLEFLISREARGVVLESKNRVGQEPVLHIRLVQDL